MPDRNEIKSALRSNWPIALGLLIMSTAVGGLVSLYVDYRGYRQTIIATTERALEAATGISSSVSQLSIGRGSVPVPIVMTLEQALPSDLGQRQWAKFRQIVRQHRCIYFDYTPKRRYPIYELQVANPSGEVAHSERLEPGSCFCGRPNWQERRTACRPAVSS